MQARSRYSLIAVGLTRKGLDKLTKAATKQLRAALRQPAHISHLATAQIWQKAGLPLPIKQLTQSLESYVSKQQARAHSSPDITTMPQVLQYAEAQLERLKALAADPLLEEVAPTSESLLTVACPECGEHFGSLNGMRIHCQLAHGRLPEHPKCPTTFDAVAHSVGGLPEFRLCRRRFFRYQQLVKHINTGACEALGWESFIRKLVEQEERQAISALNPTESSATFARADESIPECQPSRQERQLMAMTKLLLQHEDHINCLSLDRGMVMFLKEDPRSVLPAMMQDARIRETKD